MKYYLIAGERSGDLHASALIDAIKLQDPEAEFRAWGGDLMEQAGAKLVKHYREMAFMGLWEVIRNLPTISRFLRACEQDLLAHRPDALILIDYPGFNLRMARFAHQHGLKVFYYISPKLWAWNQKRAHQIKAHVDRMFVIFPFEKEFYQQYDYEVDFVGNPLLDTVSAFRPNPDFRVVNGLSARPLIAVLPGSRRQEVEKNLEVMLAVVNQFPEYDFVVAAVNNLPAELYHRLPPGVQVAYEQTYDLLSEAVAALVTSGTATLETALFGVPQVVCYKTSALTYAVGRMLIKVPFLSLVNLVARKEVVPELIQQEMNPPHLSEQLRKILPGGSHREAQLQDYSQLRSQLGTGNAANRTAELIVQHLHG